MTDLPVLLGAAAVVAATGYALWRVWGRPDRRPADGGDYLLALEAWLAGDEDTALARLKAVVQDDPSSVDPYLQLGNLLRRRGDAARAAVLHRGLTVRPGLPRAKKVAVGLALADDLVELGRWEEAGQVLDGLVRDASHEPAYWRARFAQWHGLGNQPEAARALKAARRLVAERHRPWFDAAYAAYQLDRALEHARRGESGPARDRVRDVEKLAAAGRRPALVRAVLAASEGDAHAAVTVVSDELLDSPHELAVFLPQLQEVLLKSGQYARTVAILERACQAETAPPRLWISLALLYEKLGQRDRALRLLETKQGRRDFTPDAAAPYLRVLARDAEGTQLAAVWQLLSKPAASTAWTCRACGHKEPVLRWFCTACRRFDSFGDRRHPPEAAS